ncbi:tubulin-tyrosine ligase family-domain-containing protein [Jimgerdemannia flammicorona]|uniref:Tubulin-tyrosine ligase family-domain-containing protein n=1 Tax=Jimgerdemannia flammicorona TaxID=994334 RepID=A0A433QCP6_9FUNG|nr:tubulin-tyrosine ligase family-domain-containing protein [Jimgerdemannia flammicorona]
MIGIEFPEFLIKVSVNLSLPATKDPACREAISCVYLPDALDRLSDKFVELNRKRVRDLDARAVITFKGAKDVDVDDLGDAMRAVSIDVPTSGPEPEPKRKFVYYTDHPLLAASIAYSPHFIRTTERDEADIVWVCYTLSDPRPVKRSSDVASAPQCVNQFPNQNLLTVKDLLIATLHAYFGYAELKGWVPRTYNLNTECREWLGEVVERRKRQGKRENGKEGADCEMEGNVWITKPWNGTRSEGCAVADARKWGGVAELLKQGNRRLYYSGLGKCSDAEARCRVHHFSSPDIERPYLISGKKLDLRVLAVVRSLEPLQIYLLQEDPFYARCANKEYGLGRFDDFERHFTVMKYRGYDDTYIRHHNLLTHFVSTYGQDHVDRTLVPGIHRIVKRIFAAASAPELAKTAVGVAGHHARTRMEPYEHARGIYGVDVIPDEGLMPWLLEVSFQPDLGQYMKWHPRVMADVFEFVFLNKGAEKFVQL